MIVEIIPYLRTVRGKDSFDYEVPNGVDITPGMVVEVHFRSHNVLGLVWKLKSEAPSRKVKTINRVVGHDGWMQPERRKFLQWFAEYYSVSLPTAFKTMQFPIVARPRPLCVISEVVQSTTDAAVEVCRTEIPDIVQGSRLLFRYQHRLDCIRFYRQLCTDTTGHILLLVPEYSDVRVMQRQLESVCRTIVWPGGPSASLFLRTIESLKSESSLVVIATKRAVFLNWAFFRTIIVDQEESPSHKQHELNPRYHVNSIVNHLWKRSCDFGKTPTVVCTSHAPSLETYVKSQEEHWRIIQCTRTWQSDHLTVVDMDEERMVKNYSWFSELLVQHIHSSSRAFLFLNRKGYFGVAICRDCHALLASSAIECVQCHGHQIRYVRKGTQRLEEELRMLFPQKIVMRVDRDQDAAALTIDRLRSADIIIGTEKVFRLFPLSYFDLIGILSVDHLLVYPHFRSHERVFQLLTQLFSISVRTILQTASPHHPVIRAAMMNNYHEFMKQEVAIRRSLHLPPFAERLLLINTKSKKSRTIVGALDPQLLQPDTVVDRLSY